MKKDRKINDLKLQMKKINLKSEKNYDDDRDDKIRLAVEIRKLYQYNDEK